MQVYSGIQSYPVLWGWPFIPFYHSLVKPFSNSNKLLNSNKNQRSDEIKEIMLYLRTTKNQLPRKKNLNALIWSVQGWHFGNRKRVEDFFFIFLWQVWPSRKGHIGGKNTVPVRRYYQIQKFFFSANITALIMTLSDSQLANFCRILAVAISDLDIYENKSSCKYQKIGNLMVM